MSQDRKDLLHKIRIHDRKGKDDTLDYVKMYNFCPNKPCHQQRQWSTKEWEKLFITHLNNKLLVSLKIRWRKGKPNRKLSKGDKQVNVGEETKMSSPQMRGYKLKQDHSHLLDGQKPKSNKINHCLKSGG